MLHKNIIDLKYIKSIYERCTDGCSNCKERCTYSVIISYNRLLSYIYKNKYAYVGRCQSVIIGKKIYYYGDKISNIKWKLHDGTYNELFDARIVGVTGIRVNNIQLDGEDYFGNKVEVCIDMDDVRP